jgi:hypothetical protein
VKEDPETNAVLVLRSPPSQKEKGENLEKKEKERF